jgi:hypothetical protein
MNARLVDRYSEFFTTLSRGDGNGCPLYQTCLERSDGYSCIQDLMPQLSRLRSGRCIDAEYLALGSRRSCRAIRWVEMLAQDYLERAGNINAPPVPDDIALLADKNNGIEIRVLPLKMYRGAVWKVNGRWTIFLNSNATPGRKRVTLFHEVFHILTQCEHAFKAMGRTPANGLFNEIMADHFARNILIPHPWLLQEGKHIKDPDQLAKICGISRHLALSELGYHGFI